MTAQHELSLGDCRIGGRFGAHPGLLVGSIFYDKHSLVSDPLEGTFDERRASASIEQLESLSRRYGVQMAVDVVAASPQAMERYLRFVLDRTELPVLINATEPEARIAGLEESARESALQRCVYASLTEDVDDQEIDALRRHRPGAVMILAIDIGDPTPEGCVAMVNDFFAPLLEDVGIDVPIVDVGTMDSPSVGLSIRSIQLVRERFGYPAGCAFSNCFPQWTALNEMGRECVDVSLAATVAAVRAAGADFLHYGLIERAPLAAHAAATVEVFYGFAARELDGVVLPDEHPLRNMFRRAEGSTPA